MTDEEKDNEIVKYSATFLNGIAVSLFAVVCLGAVITGETQHPEAYGSTSWESLKAFGKYVLPKVALGFVCSMALHIYVRIILYKRLK